MYMLQEVLRVAPGRQPEAVERLAWIHGLMRPNPGFVRAQVASFDGSETDLLILRVWESLEAFQTFRQTPDGQGYSRNRPPGLYEGVPVGRGWELVHETARAAASPGQHLLRVLGKAGDSRAEAVTGQGGKGAGSLQVWRCLDETPEHQGTYLVLGRFDQQGADAVHGLDSVDSSDWCSLVHDTRP